MKCENVLNGALQKGISQSYSYILSNFRKIEINFESSNKTEKELLNMIANGDELTFAAAISVFMRRVLKYAE